MSKLEYKGILINEADPSYITEFSRTLLDGFYKRDDESISEALARPAVAFSYGDMELAQRIYDYVYKGWFMYASPVLSNAQKGKWIDDPEKTGAHYWYRSTFIAEEKSQGQPISCFAFDVGDSLKDQKAVIVELADLSTAGGGTGAHLSIRAVSDKSPGPIPYMKVMDSAIGYFRQGKTRKGAIAAYMDVNHPDIVEHINFRKPGGDSKRRSDNRKQFHCAVNLTDDFIAAVKGDGTYDLKCPHTGEVHETKRAREVWEQILETRALTGEPYLLKVDEANRKLPQSQKDLGLSIRGSNLCVAPETLVLTDKGHVEISKMSGNKVNVWNGKQWSNVEIVKTGEGQELINVLTSSGFDLNCTPYHKFYIMEGNRRDGKIVQVAAQDLKEGDKLVKFETPVLVGDKVLEKAYQNGFYSGDGCLVGSHKRVYLYGEKRKLKHLFSDVYAVSVQEIKNREYFYVQGLENKFFVPDGVYTVQSRIDWLAGLLDSDGCVTLNGKSQNLQIASTEKGFLNEIQLMLQTLGVQSKVVFAREAGDFELPANDGSGCNKFYTCKSVDRLLVNGTGIVQLKSLGLLTHRLKISDHIPNRDARGFVKIKQVTKTGRISDTYCFTEPLQGMGVFNGILTGQCSEITLPTNDERTFVCCLSSLNIEKFEEWKDTSIVQDLVRFLDNILQSFIENAPEGMKKAKYSAEKERALGLGTLGYHGYLQSQGVAIESGGFNSAVSHTYKIYKLIKERGEEASRKLAVERGEPDDMQGTGYRNSRLFAIAPNANSADLLDTSPSIEPYFRNVFIKDTRAGNFTVKNRHLEKCLETYGMNNEDVWQSINKNEGRVDHLDFMSDEDKSIYKVAMGLDQHWLIELAEIRGQAMGEKLQAQSLNTFFPFGSSRKYVNSVHTKFLNSPNVLTMYYFRTEREGDADHAKAIERKALVDWTSDECISCSG